MHRTHMTATSWHVLPLLFVTSLLGMLLAACGTNESPNIARPAPPTLSDSESTIVSRLEIGEPAPDFTLSASDGSPISLAAYQGEQPVLLFFHMAGG